VKMDFALPAPGLAEHVSAYYLHRFEAPLIEDSERADVGYLRFMFAGEGHIRHRERGVVPSSPVMLVGPSTETALYSINGPLHTFGCVLLPQFWGGLVDMSAEDAANFSLDGAAVMGPDATSCFNDLMMLHDVDGMARRVDAFLLPRVKPLSPDHLKTIALIGEWLSQSPIPSTETLYSRADLSARQVMRIANRFMVLRPKCSRANFELCVLLQSSLDRAGGFRRLCMMNMPIKRIWCAR
jgi:hypothetical protein